MLGAQIDVALDDERVVGGVAVDDRGLALLPPILRDTEDVGALGVQVLVAHEEERTVANDRAADKPAPTLLAEWRRLAQVFRGPVDEAPGVGPAVPARVAEESVGTPPELVGSAARD